MSLHRATAAPRSSIDSGHGGRSTHRDARASNRPTSVVPQKRYLPQRWATTSGPKLDRNRAIWFWIDARAAAGPPEGQTASMRSSSVAPSPPHRISAATIARCPRVTVSPSSVTGPRTVPRWPSTRRSGRCDVGDVATGGAVEDASVDVIHKWHVTSGPIPGHFRWRRVFRPMAECWCFVGGCRWWGCQVVGM